MNEMSPQDILVSLGWCEEDAAQLLALGLPGDFPWITYGYDGEPDDYVPGVGEWVTAVSELIAKCANYPFTWATWVVVAEALSYNRDHMDLLDGSFDIKDDDE